MSTFTAVNRPQHPSTSHTPSRHPKSASSAASEELPSPGAFFREQKADKHKDNVGAPQEPGRSQKCSINKVDNAAAEANGRRVIKRKTIPDLGERNWPIKGIGDRRQDERGRWQYLAHWYPSRLLATDVQEASDGRQYVRCCGRDWLLESVQDSTVQMRCDVSERWVTWADTWEDVNDLKQASSAIRKFNRHADGMPDFDSGSDASDGEEDTSPMDAEQSTNRDVPHDNGEQRTDAMATAARHLTTDRYLRPGLRQNCSIDVRKAIHRNWHMSTDHRRALLRLHPVRPLMVRDGFAAKGKALRIDRAAEAYASLTQDTGYEQHDHCDRCRKGRGPFASCVVLRDFNKSACANCAYDGFGRSCNFHRAPKDNVMHRRAQDSIHCIGDNRRDDAQSSDRAKSPSKLDSREIEVDSEDTSDHGASSDTPRENNSSSPTSPPSRNEAPSPPTSLTHRANPAPEEFHSTRQQPSRQVLQSTESNVDAEPMVTNADKDTQVECDVPTMWQACTVTQDFRHAGCGGGNSACQEAPAMFMPAQGPSAIAHAVYRHQQFSEGQATNEEVNHVLSRCNCAWTKCFEEIWQGWKRKRQRQSRGRYHLYLCKERFVSKALSGFLNAAIAETCPKSLRHATGGDSLDRPIMLE